MPSLHSYLTKYPEYGPSRYLVYVLMRRHFPRGVPVEDNFMVGHLSNTETVQDYAWNHSKMVQVGAVWDIKDWNVAYLHFWLACCPGVFPDTAIRNIWERAFGDPLPTDSPTNLRHATLKEMRDAIIQHKEQMESTPIWGCASFGLDRILQDSLKDYTPIFQ